MMESDKFKLSFQPCFGKKADGRYPHPKSRQRKYWDTNKRRNWVHPKNPFSKGGTPGKIPGSKGFVATLLMALGFGPANDASAGEIAEDLVVETGKQIAGGNFVDAVEIGADYVVAPAAGQFEQGMRNIRANQSSKAARVLGTGDYYSSQW